MADLIGQGVFFPGADGLQIAATTFGEAGAPPILLLGGIGQTRHSWRRAAKTLAEAGYFAVTYDLRGHGDSDWSEEKSYGYEAQRGDLTGIVSAIGQPAIVVGASLGGKIGLASAGISGPDTVRGLVMVDTAPRNNISSVRQVINPMMSSGEVHYDTPEEAVKAFAEARNMDFTPELLARTKRNLRQTPDGRWRWHWDPSYFQDIHGLGTEPAMDYLEGAARNIKVPVLLTRGGNSQVVDDAALAALKAVIPHIDAKTIEGVGHMIVGDDNDAFTEVVCAFLASNFGDS